MTTSALPQPLPRIPAANEVIPAVKRIVEKTKAVYDHVVCTVSPADACFESVIRPVIEDENQRQGELAVIAMLRYASPDQEARDASEEASRLLEESESVLSAREDIYALVKAVQDKHEELDFESAKFLNTFLRDFHRSGMGILDTDSMQRYLTTRNHIDDLRRDYNRNIRDESGTIRFSLAELEGVPQSDLDRFSKSSEPHEDEVRIVDFSSASHDAILHNAVNPATRKKFWVASVNTLPENVPLFKEITSLRRENARLLGYNSHAAFRLEVRVAKNPEWVNNLLDSLQQALLPQGRKAMDGLLDLKKAHLMANPQYASSDAGVMRPWDYRFYIRMAEKNLQVDHSRISEYFPLPHVLPAMFEIFASCLQLRFTPLLKTLLEGATWHDDVEAWSVWDDRPSSRGEFIGYLYTDLLSRPNKYRGNQCVNLQCVCSLPT